MLQRMRRYIEEPEGFAWEFEEVNRFLREEAQGSVIRGKFLLR